MAFCKNCGNEIKEGTLFCTVCGAPLEGTANANQQANPQPNYMVAAPMVPVYDRTSEFDAEDIESNKVFAMISVICGIVGVILTYLGAKESKYAMFYAKEVLKCFVLEMILAVITSILMITIIVPIAAAIAIVVLYVCRIISFVTICQNKAVDMPVVRSFKFLGK